MDTNSGRADAPMLRERTDTVTALRQCIMTGTTKRTWSLYRNCEREETIKLRAT